MTSLNNIGIIINNGRFVKKIINKILFINFLLVWSVAVILIIKPNIVLYGVGLLSAQLAIFIHTAYETIKNSPWAKYYRGNDDE